MDELKTNTRKKDYKISVTLDGKLIATFGTHTDSVVNSLKSAYEQACGWTFTPKEELPVPPEPILKVNVPVEQPEKKKRGRPRKS